jgi:hypothetical protein
MLSPCTTNVQVVWVGFWFCQDLSVTFCLRFRPAGLTQRSGAVADFGRSCLPGRTSRLAATSLDVNRQYRLVVSLARRTRFACGESPFRQKGPTLTTIRDYTPTLRPSRLGSVGPPGLNRNPSFLQCFHSSKKNDCRSFSTIRESAWLYGSSGAARQRRNSRTRSLTGVSGWDGDVS